MIFLFCLASSKKKSITYVQVITLRRPYTFGTSKLEVTVCGVLASVVRQEATLMKPVLSIRDASDNPVLRVKGPASVAGECDFEV